MNNEEKTTEALVVTERALSAKPAICADSMKEAFEEYAKIQAVLDEKLKDQLITIGKGKAAREFRKKGYWRAVCMAFALEMELVSERRVEIGEDWGIQAAYRATTPDGRSMVGDGACMASEKYVYVKNWDAWNRAGKPKGGAKIIKDAMGKPVVDIVATAENATLHNIRGHAHTRAKNRAISDLVAFGEVTAEEITRSEFTRGDEQQTQMQQSQTQVQQADPAVVAFNAAKVKWANAIDSGQWDLAYGLAYRWAKQQRTVEMVTAIDAICETMSQGAEDDVIRIEIKSAIAGDMDSLSLCLSRAIASTPPSADDMPPPPPLNGSRSKIEIVDNTGDAPPTNGAGLVMTLAAIQERAEADMVPKDILQKLRMELEISSTDMRTHSPVRLAKLQKKIVDFVNGV